MYPDWNLHEQTLKFFNKSMEDNILQTLQYLLKDSQSLASKMAQLQQEFTDIRSEITHLQEQQQMRLSEGAFAAQAPENSQKLVEPLLLDIPLSQLMDLYREVPQVLTAYATTVGVTEETVLAPDHTPVILKKNSGGAYWVIRLKSFGELLLPRPVSILRRRSLASLGLLYDIDGPQDSQIAEFVVVESAHLETLKRQQRWQLIQRGKLKFGEVPEQFRWQEQLRQIAANHAQLQGEHHQLLELLTQLQHSNAAAQDLRAWIQTCQQQSEMRYGKPERIFINTCNYQAYASIKKGKRPQVLHCKIVPWVSQKLLPDMDLTSEQEALAFQVSEVARTSTQHPLLPDQLYILDKNEETWAVASNWTEAENILNLLGGRQCNLK